MTWWQTNGWTSRLQWPTSCPRAPPTSSPAPSARPAWTTPARGRAAPPTTSKGEEGGGCKAMKEWEESLARLSRAGEKTESYCGSKKVWMLQARKRTRIEKSRFLNSKSLVTDCTGRRLLLYCSKMFSFFVCVKLPYKCALTIKNTLRCNLHR